MGAGVDEYGNPRKMKYQRGGNEIEEVAVLVGDYPAVDDPEAQETLRKLKCYQPECLKLQEGKATYRTLAGLRWMQRKVQGDLLPDNDESKKKGPLGHAMVTTNPILPTDYYVPKGLDPLVIKANEGVKHSLLDCPGKFTLQVAHFTGRMIIDQKEIAAIEHGKEMESQLAKAALMAHELTNALRIKGYEAYEFHDRYESVVTVGSFESVGQKGANGVTELEPRIVAAMDQFKAEQKVAGAVTAKAIIGIPLDPQPMLIHVPKRTAVAALSQRPMRGLQ